MMTREHHRRRSPESSRRRRKQRRNSREQLQNQQISMPLTRYEEPDEPIDERSRALSPLSSSSSTSSSLLNISRPSQRFGLGKFFGGSGQKQHRVKKKRNRFLRFGNSSSSSVGSDLAYGKGYVERRRSREFSPTSSTHGRPALSQRAQTDEEIIELGRKFAEIARQQNAEDLRAAGRSRPSTLISAAAALSSFRRTNSGNSNRGVGSSKPRRDSSPDDSEWESASDDDSSSEFDSGLAYGSGLSLPGPSSTQLTRPLTSPRSPQSPRSPRSTWSPRSLLAPSSPPPHRKPSLVDPSLFGPVNSLHGFVETPCGFEKVDRSTISAPRRPYEPSIPPSEVLSETRPLQQLYPVPTSDPSRFDAGGSIVSSQQDFPTRARPAPVPIQPPPIQQPRPIAPVSRKVLDSVETDPRYSERSLSKSVAEEVAVAGVAGAAIGAAVSAHRKDDRDRREGRRDRDGKRRSKRSDAGVQDERAEKRTNRDEHREVREEHVERRREKRSEPNQGSERERLWREKIVPELERESEEKGRRDDYLDDNHGDGHDQVHDKRKDEQKKDREIERRESRKEVYSHRRRGEDRASRTAVVTHQRSEGSEHLSQEGPIDPFQFQVADDAFQTPLYTTPKRPLTPNVITIDREPDFSRFELREDDVNPQERLSRRDSYERELRDAHAVYEATEHATAPVSAVAFAAATAAVIAEDRRGRSHSRGGDASSRNRSRRGESPRRERDSVIEDANRYYREAELARRIKEEEERSRNNAESSVVDKWNQQKQTTINIVPPPEMDHPKKKGPYDGPDADVRIDNVLHHPDELSRFRVPGVKGLSEPPVFRVRDPSAERERPILNIVRPTPIPSPMPEEQLLAKELSSEPTKMDDTSTSRATPNTVTESRGGIPPVLPMPKAVSWGENQTKHYVVESPEREDDPYSGARVVTPAKTPRQRKKSAWGMIAAAVSGVSGASDEAASSSVPERAMDSEAVKARRTSRDQDKSTNRRSSAQIESSYDSPPIPGPKPPSPRNVQMPGTFAEDPAFTANIAAALEGSGFDPNIVIEDASFHKRDSPPGLNDSGVYRPPFVEPATDSGIVDVPRPAVSQSGQEHGFVIGEVSETPSHEKDMSTDNSRILSELNRRERRKQEKTVERDGSEKPEVIVDNAKAVDTPRSVPEDDWDASSGKLSKKERKRRDKAARAQSLEDSVIIDPARKEQELEAEFMGATAADDEENSSLKKKSKKSKKAIIVQEDPRQPDVAESSKVIVPVDAFQDVQNAKTAERPRITIPVNTFQDVQDAKTVQVDDVWDDSWDFQKKSRRGSRRDLEADDSPSRTSSKPKVLEENSRHSAESRAIPASDDEWDSSKKSSQRTKRDSEAYGSPSRAVPVSELSRESSYRVVDADSVPTTQEEWDTPKKSKKKSKRESGVYDSPSRSAPASEASLEIVRKATDPETTSLPDDDQSLFKRSRLARRGTIDDEFAASPAQSVDDWDTPRKSKKKSIRDLITYDSPSRVESPEDIVESPKEMNESSGDWRTEKTGATEEESGTPKRPKKKSNRDPITYEGSPSTPASRPTASSEASLSSSKKSKHDGEIYDSPSRSTPVSDVGADGSPMKSKKNKRRSTPGDFPEDDGKPDGSEPPDPGRGESEAMDRDISSVVSGPTRSDSNRLSNRRARFEIVDDAKSVASVPSDTDKRDRKSSKSDKDKRGSGNSSFFDRFKSSIGKAEERERSRKSEEDKKNSFLDNAGTLGAGAGSMGVDITPTSQESRSNASNAPLEEEAQTVPFTPERRSTLPLETEFIDPEIVPREIRPAIDPKHGDLLPLPPSRPGSPVPELSDDFPDLPESRPETPEHERHLREIHSHIRRRSAHETPTRPKTPSQSAIPIQFRLGHRHTPSNGRSSPTVSPIVGNSGMESEPRSRSRPTSWEGREFKPLLLLQRSRGSIGSIGSLDIASSPERDSPLRDVSPSDSEIREHRSQSLRRLLAESPDRNQPLRDSAFPTPAMSTPSEPRSASDATRFADISQVQEDSPFNKPPDWFSHHRDIEVDDFHLAPVPEQPILEAAEDSELPPPKPEPEPVKPMATAPSSDELSPLTAPGPSTVHIPLSSSKLVPAQEKMDLVETVEDPFTSKLEDVPTDIKTSVPTTAEQEFATGLDDREVDPENEFVDSLEAQDKNVPTLDVPLDDEMSKSVDTLETALSNIKDTRLDESTSPLEQLRDDDKLEERGLSQVEELPPDVSKNEEVSQIQADTQADSVPSSNISEQAPFTFMELPVESTPISTETDAPPPSSTSVPPPAFTETPVFPPPASTEVIIPPAPLSVPTSPAEASAPPVTSASREVPAPAATSFTEILAPLSEPVRESVPVEDSKEVVPQASSQAENSDVRQDAPSSSHPMDQGGWLSTIRSSWGAGLLSRPWRAPENTDSQVKEQDAKGSTAAEVPPPGPPILETREEEPSEELPKEITDTPDLEPETSNVQQDTGTTSKRDKKKKKKRKSQIVESIPDQPAVADPEDAILDKPAAQATEDEHPDTVIPQESYDAQMNLITDVPVQEKAVATDELADVEKQLTAVEKEAPVVEQGVPVNEHEPASTVVENEAFDVGTETAIEPATGPVEPETIFVEPDNTNVESETVAPQPEPLILKSETSPTEPESTTIQPIVSTTEEPFTIEPETKETTTAELEAKENGTATKLETTGVEKEIPAIEMEPTVVESETPAAKLELIVEPEPTVLERDVAVAEKESPIPETESTMGEVTPITTEQELAFVKEEPVIGEETSEQPVPALELSTSVSKKEKKKKKKGKKLQLTENDQSEPATPVEESAQLGEQPTQEIDVEKSDVAPVEVQTSSQDQAVASNTQVVSLGESSVQLDQPDIIDPQELRDVQPSLPEEISSTTKKSKKKKKKGKKAQIVEPELEAEAADEQVSARGGDNGSLAIEQPSLPAIQEAETAPQAENEGPESFPKDVEGSAGHEQSDHQPTPPHEEKLTGAEMPLDESLEPERISHNIEASQEFTSPSEPVEPISTEPKADNLNDHQPVLPLDTEQEQSLSLQPVVEEIQMPSETVKAEEPAGTSILNEDPNIEQHEGQHTSLETRSQSPVGQDPKSLETANVDESSVQPKVLVSGEHARERQVPASIAPPETPLSGANLTENKSSEQIEAVEEPRVLTADVDKPQSSNLSESIVEESREMALSPEEFGGKKEKNKKRQDTLDITDTSVKTETVKEPAPQTTPSEATVDEPLVVSDVLEKSDQESAEPPEPGDNLLQESKSPAKKSKKGKKKSHNSDAGELVDELETSKMEEPPIEPEAEVDIVHEPASEQTEPRGDDIWPDADSSSKKTSDAPALDDEPNSSKTVEDLEPVKVETDADSRQIVGDSHISTSDPDVAAGSQLVDTEVPEPESTPSKKQTKKDKKKERKQKKRESAQIESVTSDIPRETSEILAIQGGVSDEATLPTEPAIDVDTVASDTQVNKARDETHDIELTSKESKEVEQQRGQQGPDTEEIPQTPIIAPEISAEPKIISEEIDQTTKEPSDSGITPTSTKKSKEDKKDKRRSVQSTKPLEQSTMEVPAEEAINLPESSTDSAFSTDWASVGIPPPAPEFWSRPEGHGDDVPRSFNNLLKTEHELSQDKSFHNIETGQQSQVPTNEDMLEHQDIDTSKIPDELSVCKDIEGLVDVAVEEPKDQLSTASVPKDERDIVQQSSNGVLPTEQQGVDDQSPVETVVGQESTTRTESQVPSDQDILPIETGTTEVSQLPDEIEPPAKIQKREVAVTPQADDTIAVVPTSVEDSQSKDSTEPVVPSNVQTEPSSTQDETPAAMEEAPLVTKKSKKDKKKRKSKGQDTLDSTIGTATPTEETNIGVFSSGQTELPSTSSQDRTEPVQIVPDLAMTTEPEELAAQLQEDDPQGVVTKKGKKDKKKKSSQVQEPALVLKPESPALPADELTLQRSQSPARDSNQSQDVGPSNLPLTEEAEVQQPPAEEGLSKQPDLPVPSTTEIITDVPAPVLTTQESESQVPDIADMPAQPQDIEQGPATEIEKGDDGVPIVEPATETSQSGEARDPDVPEEARQIPDLNEITVLEQEAIPEPPALEETVLEPPVTPKSKKDKKKKKKRGSQATLDDAASALSQEVSESASNTQTPIDEAKSSTEVDIPMPSEDASLSISDKVDEPTESACSTVEQDISEPILTHQPHVDVKDLAEPSLKPVEHPGQPTSSKEAREPESEPEPQIPENILAEKTKEETKEGEDDKLASLQDAEIPHQQDLEEPTEDKSAVPITDEQAETGISTPVEASNDEGTTSVFSPKKGKKGKKAKRGSTQVEDIAQIQTSHVPEETAGGTEQIEIGAHTPELVSKDEDTIDIGSTKEDKTKASHSDDVQPQEEPVQVETEPALEPTLERVPEPAVESATEPITEPNLSETLEPETTPTPENTKEETTHESVPVEETKEDKKKKRASLVTDEIGQQQESTEITGNSAINVPVPEQTESENLPVPESLEDKDITAVSPSKKSKKDKKKKKQTSTLEPESKPLTPTEPEPDVISQSAELPMVSNASNALSMDAETPVLAKDDLSSGLSNPLPKPADQTPILSTQENVSLAPEGLTIEQPVEDTKAEVVTELSPESNAHVPESAPEEAVTVPITSEPTTETAQPEVLSQVVEEETKDIVPPLPSEQESVPSTGEPVQSSEKPEDFLQTTPVEQAEPTQVKESLQPTETTQFEEPSESKEAVQIPEPTSKEESAQPEELSKTEQSFEQDELAVVAEPTQPEELVQPEPMLNETTDNVTKPIDFEPQAEHTPQEPEKPEELSRPEELVQVSEPSKLEEPADTQELVKVEESMQSEEPVRLKSTPQEPPETKELEQKEPIPLEETVSQPPTSEEPAQTEQPALVEEPTEPTEEPATTLDKPRLASPNKSKKDKKKKKKASQVESKPALDSAAVVEGSQAQTTLPEQSPEQDLSRELTEPPKSLPDTEGAVETSMDAEKTKDLFPEEITKKQASEIELELQPELQLETAPTLEASVEQRSLSEQPREPEHVDNQSAPGDTATTIADAATQEDIVEVSTPKKSKKKKKRASQVSLEPESGTATPSELQAQPALLEAPSREPAEQSTSQSVGQESMPTKEEETPEVVSGKKSKKEKRESKKSSASTAEPEPERDLQIENELAEPAGVEVMSNPAENPTEQPAEQSTEQLTEQATEQLIEPAKPLPEVDALPVTDNTPVELRKEDLQPRPMEAEPSPPHNQDLVVDLATKDEGETAVPPNQESITVLPEQDLTISPEVENVAKDTLTDSIGNASLEATQEEADNSAKSLTTDPEEGEKKIEALGTSKLGPPEIRHIDTQLQDLPTQAHNETTATEETLAVEEQVQAEPEHIPESNTIPEMKDIGQQELSLVNQQVNPDTSEPKEPEPEPEPSPVSPISRKKSKKDKKKKRASAQAESESVSGSQTPSKQETVPGGELSETITTEPMLQDPETTIVNEREWPESPKPPKDKKHRKASGASTPTESMEVVPAPAAPDTETEENAPRKLTLEDILEVEGQSSKAKNVQEETSPKSKDQDENAEDIKISHPSKETVADPEYNQLAPPADDEQRAQPHEAPANESAQDIQDHVELPVPVSPPRTPLATARRMIDVDLSPAQLSSHVEHERPFDQSPQPGKRARTHFFSDDATVPEPLSTQADIPPHNLDSSTLEMPELLQPIDHRMTGTEGNDTGPQDITPAREIAVSYLESKPIPIGSTHAAVEGNKDIRHYSNYGLLPVVTPQREIAASYFEGRSTSEVQIDNNLESKARESTGDTQLTPSEDVSASHLESQSTQQEPETVEEKIQPIEPEEAREPSPIQDTAPSAREIAATLMESRPKSSGKKKETPRDAELTTTEDVSMTLPTGGVALSPEKSKKGKGKKKQKYVDKRTPDTDDIFDDPALWESSEPKTLEEGGRLDADAGDFWTGPNTESEEQTGVPSSDLIKTEPSGDLPRQDSFPENVESPIVGREVKRDLPESHDTSHESAASREPPTTEIIDKLDDLDTSEHTNDPPEPAKEVQVDEPSLKPISPSRPLIQDYLNSGRNSPRVLPPVEEETHEELESERQSRRGRDGSEKDAATMEPLRDSGVITDTSHPKRRSFVDPSLRDSGVHLRDWPEETPKKQSVLSGEERSAIGTPQPSEKVTKKLGLGSETPKLETPVRRSPEHDAQNVIDVKKSRASRSQDVGQRSISDNISRTSTPRTESQPRRSASNTSISRFRTPEPLRFRPESPGSYSFRSGTNTPPLRRVDKRMSGDLRSLSSNLSNNNASPENLHHQSTTPVANEGRVRAKDMTDVYDGYGEGRIGSPRSPTRPQSMRRRQSMQVLELESRVEQLISENRALADAKAQAEQNLNYQAVSVITERDAEIESLKASLEWLRKEVTRLTEINEGLHSANNVLALQHNEKYGQLESRHASTFKELEEHRSARNLYTKTLEEKDAEIQELRAQLEATKEQVREMQRQILATKPPDAEFLRLKDEDHFDHRCQQLCSHVQQWVLRFSKFSDMRACRLTREINDEKVIDRLDNSVLDASEVDDYLGDRVRRRDIFMSMTMNMIWEFVFTRYLFGMDREQRQKLKSLEKLLLEVGPPQAVRQWRAVTLTLLSKRPAFGDQRNQDTEAVVQAVFQTLCMILPPPSNLESQIQSQLRRVMREAVDLSIEMRTQRAEYMMLPLQQPEYDANGDLAKTVAFNAALMNERSGDKKTNEQYEAEGAIVRIVLFPLVVKKGDDNGVGDEEIVICPAQVLVAKPPRHATVRMVTPSSDAGGVPLSRGATPSMAGQSTNSLQMQDAPLPMPTPPRESDYI